MARPTPAGNQTSADPRTPPSDGRSTRYSPRRRRLVVEAREVCLARGIEGLSMRALADAIGVSHSALRRHFGSMDVLLHEVYRALQDESLTAYRDVGDGRAALRAMWAQSKTERGLQSWRLVFTLYGRAFAQPDRYAWFLEDTITTWVTAVSDDLRSSGLSAQESASLATLYLAQFRGLQLDRITTGDDRRVDRAFEHWMTRTVARPPR